MSELLCVICNRPFLLGEAIHRKRFVEDVPGAPWPVIIWALVHPPCRDEWDEDQLRPHKVAELVYPYARRQYGAA